MMIYFCSITTKYFGPSNVRGSRIIATRRCSTAAEKAAKYHPIAPFSWPDEKHCQPMQQLPPRTPVKRPNGHIWQTWLSVSRDATTTPCNRILTPAKYPHELRNHYRPGALRHRSHPRLPVANLLVTRNPLRHTRARNRELTVLCGAPAWSTDWLRPPRHG